MIVGKGAPRFSTIDGIVIRFLRGSGIWDWGDIFFSNSGEGMESQKPPEPFGPSWSKPFRLFRIELADFFFGGVGGWVLGGVEVQE